MTQDDENARLKAEISALKQRLTAQEEKLCNASRLRHLIDQMPGGVVVIDRHGRVSDFNIAAEKLLGVKLSGMRWLDVIRQCFAPRPDDGHEISLKNGRRISLATRPLEGGEPGQLLFLNDQTMTRQLQQRINHMQRLSEMGRMMASLAHQVRTPLTAALLYSSHLQAAQLTEEQRIRFAGKVKSRLQHLEQQVRDMLLFAKGEMKLEDRLSCAELMRDIEEHLDVPLTQADADCDFIDEAADRVIQCNRETLLGAVINLVNNALEAKERDAHLIVRVKPDSDGIRLEIIDDGPGMSVEQIAQSMQPFYTTKSHGTGLGLAVAQVIARAHQGKFNLNSKPGEGTNASFWLPVIPSA